MNATTGKTNGKIKIRAIYCLLILIVLSLSSSLSFAQNISVNDNLSFGSIFPGVPKTVSKYTAGEAAEFHIDGTANAEITIDFTLPPYMYTTGDNMQIVFSTTDCAYDTSAVPDQTHPMTDNINPRHTIITRLGSSGLTIWLGGSVIPTLNQKTGDYSGIIVLTISYTSN